MLCRRLMRMQVERQQRRLLRSLALQPEQRAHCAQIWRQWYKKRRMLDREFDDAMCAIADRIPQATDVPAALVKLLDCLAQVCPCIPASLTRASTVLRSRGGGTVCTQQCWEHRGTRAVLNGVYPQHANVCLDAAMHTPTETCPMGLPSTFKLALCHAVCVCMVT